MSATEFRRQKRIDDQLAATTCFACREKGHAARNCPVTKNMSSDGGKSKSNAVVGICYRSVTLRVVWVLCLSYSCFTRCGSTSHTLSRCKKLVDNSNPLPFASCFVCNGKGHLASSCPQNTAKGVYPDGGCCKLCGETSHLARDCGLRKRGKLL